ncbi:unnamed protein product [Caenorhabditis sp. 36 PRJEB53466]|nr:unnamed protein product [Caenorhabditis sp. 36 PRJEB53466]
MSSFGPLIDIAANHVAQMIIDQRIRLSTIDFPVPCGNKVFEYVMEIWSNVGKRHRQKREKNVLRELAHLEITEADFRNNQIDSRFFPFLLKQSLVSLTIGYEGSVVNGDEDENAGDEVHQMDIVQLLQNISSEGTHESLMHLDVSAAPSSRFNPKWMEKVADMFPNLESLNITVYRNTKIAQLVHCFPDLKSLKMSTSGGTRSIKGISRLRKLEILTIDDIRNLTDVTELFELENLRVLSVPGTNSETRPFIRRFRDCLEVGFTLPELRYFDCSEATSDVEYEEIVRRLPKLEHFTCIGGTLADVNLPSHKIDTVEDTVATLEHYVRQKCYGMQILVLRLNPMSKIQPETPECSPSVLRKFRDTLHKIMSQKATECTLATFVVLNYPKLLKLMLTSGSFSDRELHHFLLVVLKYYRKFRRFQFPLRTTFHVSFMNTIVTPGVKDHMHRPQASDVFQYALRSMRDAELRECALGCLVHYYQIANLNSVEAKNGCKYLAESLLSWIIDPNNEVSQRYILQCLLIIRQLVAVRSFEEPDNITTHGYSPNMILLFCQLLLSNELGRCLQRNAIKESILSILLKIVRRDDYSLKFYDDMAINSVWFVIDSCRNNSVQSVETAVAILAKLIMRSQQLQEEKGNFYSARIVVGVRWLLENASPTPTHCWINWNSICGEIETATYVGTVAAHVYAILEYVRRTEGAPLYAQNLSVRDVIQKLSCGRWKDGTIDGLVLAMAIDIRRITEQPNSEPQQGQRQDS